METQTKKPRIRRVIPKLNSVTVPSQLTLKGFRQPNSSELVMAMGRFYETLTAGFYGGHLNDVKFRASSKDYEGGTIPDVVDLKRKRGTEVKSFSEPRSCNVMNRQTRGNFGWISSRPGYSFRYALYQHRAKGVKSWWKPSFEELFQKLSETTNFSVVFPYDVMLGLALSSEKGKRRIVRHYKGEIYPDCSCLNSKPVRELFEDPESALEEAGFDPENYTYRRLRSPKGYIINDEHELNDFEIMVIERKDFVGWFSEAEKDEGLIKKINEELSWTRGEK